MEIQRIKKISEAKINAGNVVNKVRNTLKEYEHGRQDAQEDLSEVFKPIVKSQEDVKDKMLEQLQKNQKALKSGLEDLIILQQLPDVQPQQTDTLPIDYKPEMMKPGFKSNIDAGFDSDEIKKLTKYELYPPSQVLQASIDGTLDIDEYDENLGKKLNKLGAKKGNLSKGKGKTKNKEEIEELTKDIKLIQKYRDN